MEQTKSVSQGLVATLEAEAAVADTVNGTPEPPQTKESEEETAEDGEQGEEEDEEEDSDDVCTYLPSHATELTLSCRTSRSLWSSPLGR